MRALIVCVLAGSAAASDGLSLEEGETLLSAKRYAVLQEEDDPYGLGPKHTGLYFRASGLVVEQLNDVRNLDTGETIGFDTGGGLSMAVGYADLQIPAAFEVEYAFRRINANDDRDGRVNLHTISANVLFDMSDLVGPFGVYGGGGIGVTIDEISIASSGGQTFVGVKGGRFFWQAMAGLTLSVHDRAQLYAGVRWTDSGTYEDEEFRFHSEALNYEFGARFFF